MTDNKQKTLQEMDAEAAEQTRKRQADEAQQAQKDRDAANKAAEKAQSDNAR